MTEAVPRGQMGPGPATMPAVSCFEFILNEKLLEEHLTQENPGNNNIIFIQICFYIFSTKTFP